MALCRVAMNQLSRKIGSIGDDTILLLRQDRLHLQCARVHHSLPHASFLFSAAARIVFTISNVSTKLRSWRAGFFNLLASLTKDWLQSTHCVLNSNSCRTICGRGNRLDVGSARRVYSFLHLTCTTTLCLLCNCSLTSSPFETLHSTSLFNPLATGLLV